MKLKKYLLALLFIIIAIDVKSQEIDTAFWAERAVVQIVIPDSAETELLSKLVEKETNEDSASVTTIAVPLVSSTTSSTSMVMRFLSESGIAVTNNNDVKLLKGAREKFEELFISIENARHHIHLEYFNFRNDSIGNALFDLLEDKAEEGVEVRVIFDDFGNWSNNCPLKKKDLEEIRENNIEVVVFDPIRFPYVNHVMHRDHRKIAVIDGEIAYTGGINVADYYINGHPKIGSWHDTHVRIEGVAVKDLQEIFLDMWNKNTKQNIGGEEYFPMLTDIPEDFDGKHVAIIDRSPKREPEQMRHTYAKSIASAQRKIQIVNPYFLPPSSIKKELRAALKRGVKVEIMFSPKADIKFTPDGSVYAAYRLMKEGADVYLYDGGFHHSKTMVIDDSFCTVGTTNLDSRSLRYDYEVNAFIFDEEISKELNEIFDADKASCIKLTHEEWKKRSLWKRFVGWCANVLTPFL